MALGGVQGTWSSDQDLPAHQCLMQVEELLQEQRTRAKELLSQHRDKVEALAQELMLKRVRMIGWHELGAEMQSRRHPVEIISMDSVGETYNTNMVKDALRHLLPVINTRCKRMGQP
jgi:hypothetical protein